MPLPCKRSLRSFLPTLILLALILPALLGSDLPAQELNQPPEGYRALFNGKDLDRWYGLAATNPEEMWKLTPQEQLETKQKNLPNIQEHWTVKEGVLVNDGKGLLLTTEDEFRDFDLTLEYKTIAGADSGVYLKATPQVQIWDSTDETKFKHGAEKGSGGLWNNKVDSNGKDPLVLADKPFGEWNQFRIRQIGARTSVWLNDKKVVDNAIHENFFDRSRPLFAKGPIQLQTHGGEISWRNVFIKEYSAEQANQILREQSAVDAFVEIFNGKDLAGWAGATDGYQVTQEQDAQEQDAQESDPKGTVLMCKPDTGGTVYYDKELTDFVARFEFKLPPGGNNGLAIRYPGEGDTAYVGMCELQVLDSEHPKFATLDARQFHGSAYGMAAAHRGYLRPTGQWNYQEVTVKGTTIKVELNGTVILDCDLSTVDSYYRDSPHPGKLRKKGFFGFAGHGDAVRFRKVELREL